MTTTKSLMFTWPWVVAVLLAVGGSFWGVLLLAAFGPIALIPLPFGIGYALTVGYLVRCFTCPSLLNRRLIWAVSGTVQGAWLLADLKGGLAHALEKPVPLLWWAFATLASVIALVAEVPGESEQR
jgi:hypothetical protein